MKTERKEEEIMNVFELLDKVPLDFSARISPSLSFTANW